MLVRRRGIGLLGAAAIGGTAYHVGSRRAKNQAEMQQLHLQQEQLAEQQISNQQQQTNAERAEAPLAQAPPASTVSQEQKIEQLKQLASLKEANVLSDAEFEVEKQKILQQ